MKLKAFIMLSLFFSSYACTNPTSKDKATTADSAGIKADSSTAMQSKKNDLADTSGKKPTLFDSKKGYVLSYKSDSLEQRLKLVKRGKDSMDFCLILTNVIEKVSDTLSGGLMYTDSGGSENETADDGSGFFFDNWNYTNKNGCQMNFTIDTDSAHYVHIYDFGCAKKLKTHSPVQTKHILKRVDIP